MVSGGFVDGVGFRVLVSDAGSVGVRTISATYELNDTYNSASGTGSLTVLKHDTVLGVSGVTGYVGDTVCFVASVKDENGGNVGTGVLDWFVFPERGITLNLSDWSYGKLDGTSVPDASLIAPTVANGELSTGRGNVVYYTTPLPSDLSEYTIRCKVHGTRLYNRIGISTITTNNDSTISIDLSKVPFLRDITGVVDDSTTYELEFKFLNNICYIYCDNSYTGISANYTGINDDLYIVAFTNSIHNNAITPVVIEELSYVDCVDLNTVPTGGGAMIKTLDTDITTNWTVIGHPTLATTPTVFNEDGTITLGQRQQNLISIPDKTKQYRIRVHQNNASLAIGVGYINNGTVNNVSPYLNTLFSNISTNTENEYILSFTDEGVTLSDGTDTVILTTRTNDTHIDIYNNNTTNDKLITITEEDITTGGGGAMTKYNLTKQGSMHENNLSTIFPTGTTNNDRSLHVGNDWIIDNFQYNNNTDWIVNMELQINTLNSSMLGIYGITDLNGGLFNIPGKWIDYDDNTDIGIVRINLNQISYGDNSTLQINITKNEDTLTWKLTDDNGNTQTVVLNNYSTTSNERFSMRCTGATTDIDMISYTRLTKLED